jgi:hypothetical protein
MKRESKEIERTKNKEKARDKETERKSKRQ